MNKGRGGKDNPILKDCRSTKSRRAVVEALEAARLPMSAEDIFIRIKEAGNSANLSTVYRTLELLEGKGLVTKTAMAGCGARYELTDGGHRHHLICVNCRKMVSIDVCPLIQLEKDIVDKTNFDITGHKLEIYGLCPECRKE